MTRSSLADVLRENNIPDNVSAQRRREAAIERDKILRERQDTELFYRFLTEAETSIQQQIIDGWPSPRVDVPLYIAERGFTFNEELAEMRSADSISRAARAMFAANLEDLGLTYYTDSDSSGEFIRVKVLEPALEQHGDVGTFGDRRKS